MPAGKLRALGLPRMVLLAGAVASIVAAASAPRSASTAASQVWPAFVLVIGLLLVGFAAAQDGAFTGMAAALDRLPGRPWLRYASSMALVAATSVLLNLDTAVLFLTPVLVLLARRQEAGEQAFLYGCVFVANSASLLLPGSNLTNLIVLQRDHLAGTQFAARLWPAWLVAVVVTAAVTAVLLRGHRGARAETHRPPPHRPYLSSVAIAAVTVALLASMLFLAAWDHQIPPCGGPVRSQERQPNGHATDLPIAFPTSLDRDNHRPARLPSCVTPVNTLAAPERGRALGRPPHPEGIGQPD